MGSDWPILSVNELITQGAIARPLDGNHGSAHPKGDDFVPQGIPFIMASDLTNGRIDIEHCKFIRREQADSLRKGFAITGDVLLSHKATIGRTAIVGQLKSEYIMLTPQVTYYRVLDPSRINNRYLKYYFDSRDFQNVLAAWAGGGSTRAYLGITGQLKLPILLPPIDIQETIAQILGAFDDQIEVLSSQQNRTLGQIGQALFRSWFIDFDPVRAKAAGRNADLPEYIADCFPDSLEDSEIGDIPCGWETRSLDEIADFLNGIACQKYPADDGEPSLPVIKIRELRNGISSSTDRATPSVPGKYVVNNGDVLFSWSGSLLVDVWTGGRGVLNQHVFKVTSLEYPKWFYYCWTAYHLNDFRRIAADKATTMGHIKRHHLSDAMVVVPPKSVMDIASELIGPTLDAQIENSIQASKAAGIRDALLPPLISGEFPIQDTQRFLKERDL